MMRDSRLMVIVVLCLSVLGCGMQESKVATSTDQTKTSTQNQIEKNEVSSLQGLQLNQWVSVVLDQKQLEKLQSGEKDGHLPGLLLPDQAASDFVMRNEKLKKLGIHFPEKSILSSDGTITYSFSQSDQLILHLIQPVTQGKGGIWAVDRYMISVKE